MNDNISLQIELYDRLLFESIVLRHEIENILTCEKHQINQLKDYIQHIQKQFYTITNNLHNVKTS